LEKRTSSAQQTSFCFWFSSSHCFSRTPEWRTYSSKKDPHPCDKIDSFFSALPTRPGFFSFLESSSFFHLPGEQALPLSWRESFYFALRLKRKFYSRAKQSLRTFFIGQTQGLWGAFNYIKPIFLSLYFLTYQCLLHFSLHIKASSISTT
jgi:hypothetical protein